MVKGKRTLVLLLPAMAAMALVALLLVASNVVAGSHRQEQAHHQSGAVGASAAWSSGWVDINPGETMTFTHNLGGNPDDYAVELWYQDTMPGGHGINHRGAGGLEAGGKYYGVHWQNLTDTTVQVIRRPDDTFADQVRVRIWIPDPPAWDSGWVDIASGTLQTLTHNVGGNADDYTVGLWFKDTAPDGIGINARCYGGLEAAGQLRGAAWQNLTATTIDVLRYKDDEWADQVRVRIFVPDLPDWDSGWVDVATGTAVTLSHNLGGNPNSYVVRGESKDLASDGIGINHRFAGGYEVGGKFFGANWEKLTNTTIDFFRRPNDWVADQVRVRIWVREFEVYLPVIFKATEIATTTAR